MQKLFSKTIYKPRFIGFRALRSLVTIADGILSLLVSPFPHIECDLSYSFSFWNIKKDLERRKKK